MSLLLNALFRKRRSRQLERAKRPTVYVVRLDSQISGQCVPCGTVVRNLGERGNNCFLARIPPRTGLVPRKCFEAAVERHEFVTHNMSTGSVTLFAGDMLEACERGLRRLPHVDSAEVRVPRSLRETREVQVLRPRIRLTPRPDMVAEGHLPFSESDSFFVLAQHSDGLVRVRERFPRLELIPYTMVLEFQHEYALAAPSKPLPCC